MNQPYPPPFPQGQPQGNLPAVPQQGYVQQTAPGAPYPSTATPAGSYSLMPGDRPTEKQIFKKFSGGWGTTFILLFMVALGGLFVFLAVQGYLKDKKYEKEGVKVEGLIHSTRYTTSRSRRGGTSYTYYAKYSYWDKQKNLTFNETSVSKSKYDEFNNQIDQANLRKGPAPKHMIEYLPDESRLYEPHGNGTHIGLFIAGSIVALIGVAIRHFSHKSARRRVKTLFTGQILPGQVIVSEPRGSGKSLRYVIQFRYMDPNGGEQTSKNWTVPAEVQYRHPVGSIIPVTIDPNDPKRRVEPDLYGVRANG